MNIKGGDKSLNYSEERQEIAYMFQSESICILTAGPTIDGRHVEQSTIDEIAETYDPERYTARINRDHWQWGEKLGSVLSVEARGNKLFAVLKPNSLLLKTVEEGQLLHTSCEFLNDFAKTGKAYLTGLAMTDEPASLGTTQVHLSSKKTGSQDTESVSSGETYSLGDYDDGDLSRENKTLLSCITNLFKSGKLPPPEEQESEMDKETKELLTKNTEQGTAIITALTALTVAVEKLSKTENEEPPEGGDETAEAKLEALTAKVDTLTEKLGKLTDEEQRDLAGEDDEEYML